MEEVVARTISGLNDFGDQSSKNTSISFQPTTSKNSGMESASGYGTTTISDLIKDSREAYPPMSTDRLHKLY